MTNELKKTFTNALGINESEYKDSLKMGDIPEWDSVGHLGLIFEIENDFNVKFDIEMIPKLDSIIKIAEELKKLNHE